MQNILKVNQLSVSFEQNEKTIEVVHQISFCLKKGKTLALVGESGSGKSVSAMSILRLLPKNHSHINAKSILYYKDNEAIDLNQASLEQLYQIRGKEIAVIFQDPMTALNPVQTIGKQIEEVLVLHCNNLNQKDYKKEIIYLLDRVGIKDPEERIKNYPHQLSGGMRQRVMIAIALATKPKVLIADEPTTALDVTIQAQILSLIQDLQEEYQMAILFISHDLSVVRALSDEIAVMYQGNIVETNQTEMLINEPKHPYTVSLLKDSQLIRG